MLKTIRRMGERKRLGAELCARIVERSRAPVFFTGLMVPDTLDGRFDVLSLHAWLVLERLSSEEERDAAQALTDAIFIQFDEGLRDLGVGDIGIGHRVKKMANAFYGRLHAYGGAKDEPALASAILRNIYRGDDAAASFAQAIARYAANARETLKGWSLGAPLEFGPLPAIPR